MYVLKNNTCGRIKEVSTLKSSSFDCSETRVIFIEGYVSTVKSVHPTSIAVKHVLFSSNNTCGRMKEAHPASIAVKHALFSSKVTCHDSPVKSVHPTSIAVKHALFSSNNTCGRMKEAHPASLIFIE